MTHHMKMDEADGRRRLDDMVQGVLGTGLDRFQRVDATSQPAGVVDVPGWSCVAPMLGGPDGRTLIMVTNFMERPDDILSGKAKGLVLTTQVDIPAAKAS